MKKAIISAVFVFLAVSVLRDSNSPASAQAARENVKLPPVEAVNLENGIRLFYIGDELPQVTIVVSVGFGKLYENKENAGISELIAKTISLGGSRKYPGGALHEKVDSMGGKLMVTSMWENTVISIKVLDRFAEEAFAIVADLVGSPNLGPPYLDNAKSLVADSIRRKYDNPAEIAFDKVREIIFGGDGYGANPAGEKIMSYSPEAVSDTWRRYYGGRNVMVGISASMPFDAASALSRKYFMPIAAGDAASYGARRETIVETVKGCSGKIFFYPKSVPQSTVIVGTIAPDIRYQGDYALEIMNYILGGGSFSSRLMTEIRVKRGLAYAVQSIVKFRRDTGVFLAYAQVENKTVAETLGLLSGNIALMAHENIGNGELEWAQRSISNSFIFQFDTPMNILSNYMEVAYNGLPSDYYLKYLAHINAVTAQDILSESRRLLEHGLVTVVVGNESVLPELKKKGDVVIVK